MQKINFFEKLAKGFNPSSAKEIVKLPLGEGFKYLALLVLLISLFISLYWTISFYSLTRDLPEKVKTFFSENLKDFPEITIKNGKVFSTKDPFLKEWNFKEGKEVFVIDTKAEKKDIVFGRYSSYREGFFLLKDKLIMKSIEEDGKEEIETYPLPEDLNLNIIFNPSKNVFLKLSWDGKNFELTSYKIAKWKNIFSIVIFPLGLIFLFIIKFIGKIFQIFVLSIISLIVNKAAKRRLKYSQLLNIGIFFLTLPLILETIVLISGLNISGFGLFNSVLYIGFLITGILKCEKVLEKENRIDKENIQSYNA